METGEESPTSEEQHLAYEEEQEGNLTLVIADPIERRKELDVLQSQCILAARWISLTGLPGVDNNEIDKALKTLKDIDEELNDSELTKEFLDRQPHAHPIFTDVHSVIRNQTWNHTYMNALKARGHNSQTSALMKVDRPLFRFTDYMRKHRNKLDAHSRYRDLFQAGSEDVEFFKPPPEKSNPRLQIQRKHEREEKMTMARRKYGAKPHVWKPPEKPVLKVNNDFVPRVYAIAERQADANSSRRKEIEQRSVTEFRQPKYREPKLRNAYTECNSRYKRLFSGEADDFFAPPDEEHNPRKLLERRKQEENKKMVKSPPLTHNRAGLHSRTPSPGMSNTKVGSDFIPRVYAVAQRKAEQMIHQRQAERDLEQQDKDRLAKAARNTRSPSQRLLRPTEAQSPPRQSPRWSPPPPSPPRSTPRVINRKPPFQYAIEQPTAVEGDEEDDLTPFCWLYGAILFSGNDSEEGCLQRAVSLIDKMADKGRSLNIPAHVVLDIIANKKVIMTGSPFAVGGSIHEYVMSHHMPEPLTSCFVGVSDNSQNRIGRDAYCTSLDISQNKFILEDMVDNEHHFIVAPPDAEDAQEDYDEEEEDDLVGRSPTSEELLGESSMDDSMQQSSVQEDEMEAEKVVPQEPHNYSTEAIDGGEVTTSALDPNMAAPID